MHKRTPGNSPASSTRVDLRAASFVVEKFECADICRHDLTGDEHVCSVRGLINKDRASHLSPVVMVSLLFTKFFAGISQHCSGHVCCMFIKKTR